MADVQFANLSVRFGEEEMLDYPQLVAGAFLKDTYVRKYGRSMYHFFETEIGLLNQDNPMSLAIWGRLVKETTLEREQYFENGALVEDRRFLESAPTSFFVLFVADHRVAFIPETKFAPTLGNLETTIRRFVKKEYDVWAKDQYDHLNAHVKRTTWKDFYNLHPSPDVSLVPLTARESIEAFVGRFAKIETLTVHVVKRNQDMNGGELFEALVHESEELGAISSRFVVNGPKDEGLNIDKTSKFVSETTSGGYERVSMRGIDGDGHKLKGSNEDFKLTEDIDVESLSTKKTAERAFEAYNANKLTGAIKVTERDVAVLVPKLKQMLLDDED